MSMKKKDRYLEQQRRRNLLVERSRTAQNQPQEERRSSVIFNRQQGVTVDPVSTAVQLANGDIEVHFYGGETKMEKLAMQLFINARGINAGNGVFGVVDNLATQCTREAHMFFKGFYTELVRLQNEEIRLQREEAEAQRQLLNQRVADGETNVYENPEPQKPTIILPAGVE